ncbi:hypothetical protein ABKV19_027428 [Rosa sericea]
MSKLSRPKLKQPLQELLVALQACKLQIFSGHKGNWVYGLSEDFKFVLSSFWIPLSASAGEGYEVPKREEYPSSLENKVRDGDETRKVEGKEEDFSIWNRNLDPPSTEELRKKN